jgi:hypothetical protein
MAHRTQITLTDRQYAQLKRRSELTGVSLAELVRRALSNSYGLPEKDDWAAVLTSTAGAWRRREDGASYVERFRPGLAARLKS